MLLHKIQLRSWLRRMVLLRGVALLAALVCICAAGQSQQNASAGENAAIRKVSPDEYRAHIERLQALVRSCRKEAAACDSTQVGDDERIESAGAAGFEARWSWLRGVISDAHNAAMPDRDKRLQQAASRLDEDAGNAADSTGGATQQGNGFERARASADTILAQPEFRTVTQESLWDREMTRIIGWLDRLFSGVSRFGERSPWVVPLLQWGSIGLAAVVVLVWALRTMQRQRLAVSFEAKAGMEPWQKESDNWAELARVQAEKQAWRDAVHCLYWATIVMMEGRKLWRQNRARTPREYLSLLEHGSAMQQKLRHLTQIFERIWYGLRPAAETDYKRALALFEELRLA